MRLFFICLAAFAALLAMQGVASADVDQAALNNCLCECGCSAAGWGCGYNVGCSYNTDTSTDPPDTTCGNIANGPCRCSGWGCGRTQMVSSGDCYMRCMVSYGGATPVPTPVPTPFCGDMVCEPLRGENCGSCPNDCRCLPNTEICAAGDPSADARGCIMHVTAQCGDGSCNGYEDVRSCPEDCNHCGDSICSSPYESYDSCPVDCPSECGDGICGGTEDYISCPEDCTQSGPGEAWTPGGYEPPEETPEETPPDVNCSTGLVLLGFAALTGFAAWRK